jgi:hypothetical protein
MVKASICLSLIALSFFLASPVQAAGITISPPFQDITLDQNQSSQDISIGLLNSTDGAIDLSLSAVDFGDLNQSGGVLFTGLSQSDFDHKHGLAAWMTLDQDHITLAAHSHIAITAHLRNDASLTPGGHYGAVLATSRNDSDTKQVEVHQSLACLLFVTKIGGEVYGINLSKLKPDNSWWGDVSATTAEFRNDGNVHVIPRGIVQVTDPIGRVIGKGVINTNSSILLPDQSRTLDIPIIQLGLALLPGTYRITGQYRYDGTQVLQIRTQTFYQIGLLTPIILLLLLIGGGWWLQRRIQSRT